MVTAISHETSASEPTANKRRYRSPRRTKVGEEKRKALIKAALDLIASGHFRFGAQELADKAGVRRQAICRYFGSVDLLYRVLAREKWEEIVPHMPFATGFMLDHEAKAAAWTLLVGKPRELS